VDRRGAWSGPLTLANCFVTTWEAAGAVVEIANNNPLTMIGCTFAFSDHPAVFAFGGSPPRSATIINVGHNNPGNPLQGLTDGNYKPLPGWCDGLTISNLYRVNNVNGTPIPGSAVFKSTPRRSARQQATIPHGPGSITVLHGLGAEPAIEDVGCVPTGAGRVWLTSLTATQLMFRTDSVGLVPFLWSACLR